MKVLLVQGGKVYNNELSSDEYFDHTMSYVKIYACYPTLEAPKGIYNVYLQYPSDGKLIERQIGKINYNNEVKKWIIDNNPETIYSFWKLYTENHEDIPSFKIVTKPDNEDINKNAAEIATNQWRYVLYIKNKEDNDFDGKKEDPNLYDNVTEDFCMESVYITGPERTIAAVCPIDSETNKPMDACFNWQRKDLIGKKCFIYSPQNDDNKPYDNPDKKKFLLEFLENGRILVRYICSCI